MPGSDLSRFFFVDPLLRREADYRGKSCSGRPSHSSNWDVRYHDSEDRQGSCRSAAWLYAPESAAEHQFFSWIVGGYYGNNKYGFSTNLTAGAGVSARLSSPLKSDEAGVMADGSAAKRVVRTKAEQRAEMLEQILDAAEYLFSRNGLHGVALRDVAERVGVHVTLMHYYFKDKRGLFEAAFARRAGITVKGRMQALERYEAEAGDHPTVEGALHAFLDTDLDLYFKGAKSG